MKILLLLITICTATPAFARIGETQAQAEQRYGKHISVTVRGGYFECVYHKDGIEVTADFADGSDKIVHIVFRKLDGLNFTPEEFKMLARAQGVDRFEDDSHYVPSEMIWTATSSDISKPDAVVVTYDRSKKQLYAMTTQFAKEFSEKNRAFDRAVAEKKLSGF